MFLKTTLARTAAAATLALLLTGAGRANATVIIQDFFGSTDDFHNGFLTRHDAAGAPVFMQTGRGPTLIGIDGLRAQFPDNSSEVWVAPGIQHGATWFFAQASADPNEIAPPNDNNLVLVSGADNGTGGDLAALLPLTPPLGAFQVSADLAPNVNSGVLGDWIALGFTSSVADQTNNFERFGQAWLMLRSNPIVGVGDTTWELHTNGMAGPSLTGTTIIGGFIPTSLIYDPVAHTVRGSINGVLTPTLSYTATGIEGVGLESMNHIGFGTADNFAVQTVPDLAAVPEPGAWMLLIAGFGLVGAALRRARATATAPATA